MSDKFRDVYDKAAVGVTRHTSKSASLKMVREISASKNEPDWMLELRLKALAMFKRTPMPAWGPSLSGLDLDQITYFVRTDAEESQSWSTVPDKIRETFEKIGIPEAERHALSGVGAQYDSEMVYHNLKKEWEDKGVIFENMDVAVQKYPELVKKYFMTDCIPPHDHKFIMLHAAVWSGGTFGLRLAQG
jgi:Fe-S cluster assembly protein SufB